MEWSNATLKLLAPFEDLVFLKFVVVYLLFFVTYLAYVISKLTPDHMQAASALIGGLGAFLVGVIGALIDAFPSGSKTFSELDNAGDE